MLSNDKKYTFELSCSGDRSTDILSTTQIFERKALGVKPLGFFVLKCALDKKTSTLPYEEQHPDTDSRLGEVLSSDELNFRKHSGG